MIQYTIEKTLAEIGSTSTSAKRLTLTSWNGRAAKLDLRVWRTEPDEVPSKGVTLSDEEARILRDTLNAYFSAKDAAAG